MKLPLGKSNTFEYRWFHVAELNALIHLCDCTEFWEQTGRCGRVHLEKAEGSERVAGRGRLENFVATEATLWEILTGGIAEAVSLGFENVFWERQKWPQETDALKEIGSLIISNVSAMDGNHSLMKTEWIAVIAAFSGGRTVQSMIDVALAVPWFLVFQSSCHFLGRDIAFSLCAT